MGLVKIVATDDAYENDPESGCRFVKKEKLINIYKEFRENIFVGEPIQENSGDNNLVFSGRFGPKGNYGWQLFRTPKGTAVLEYRGPVSYHPHQRKPHTLGKEEYLQEIWVTFHQEEEVAEKAKEIIAKHTEKRKSRLKHREDNNIYKTLITD